MSVLVGTQEVLNLRDKEPGKARPANREQSAVEGCRGSLRLHRRIALGNHRSTASLVASPHKRLPSCPPSRGLSGDGLNPNEPIAKIPVWANPPQKVPETPRPS